MILCLDVGNTQIYGGVFANNQILLRFRYSSKSTYSSDQYGIFLKSALRENDLDFKEIKQIAMCSVVPSIDYPLRSACIKYLGITPFVLQAGVKTGLKINYRNPLEVGADRIANAIAASSSFPNKNLIIIDFGTATTVCAINSHREYLGGLIMPGIQLAMNALQANTAKLSMVEIIKPKSLIGRSTTECIQAGLFYSQLATIKHTVSEICATQFMDTKPVIIGTGGFANLFVDQDIFSVLMPDLVLYGLNIALQLNNKSSRGPILKEVK